MDNLKKFINSRNPKLILYHAGHGGEHITSTIASYSSDYNSLPVKYHLKNNRVNANCIIRYIDAGPTDINSIDPFIDYSVLAQLGTHNVLIKDHPVESVYNFYKKHFPDIEIIFLVAEHEYAYFNSMGCKKMANKVYCEDITAEYLLTNIDSSLTLSEINKIKKVVNACEWIWEHELFHLTKKVKTEDDFIFKHVDDLERFISDHSDAYFNDTLRLLEQFKTNFDDVHVINIDSLRHDGVEFWTSMSSIINNLNVEKAISASHTWINRNNNLMRNSNE